MDSVMRLMKEVECEEKAAEQANLQATGSSSDIIAKVYQLQHEQQRIKKTNEMVFLSVIVFQEVGIRFTSIC